MKKLFSFILALVCFGGGLAFTFRGYENPYPHLCDLVAQKIFLPDEQVRPWREVCLKRSQLVKISSPSALIAKDMNNLMALLEVSHLEVLEARKVKEVWQGAILETGIEARFIDGELVVTEVYPDSPASESGIVLGDVILSVNGASTNQWEVKTEKGDYEILRQKDNVKALVKLEPRELVVDQSVKVLPLRQINYIRVPSFRASFFDDDQMRRIKDQLRLNKANIVDLRGNQGGNFVAGLRFLSLFFCEATIIGDLHRPRSGSDSKAELVDDLNDLNQIQMLNQNRQLILKTYPSASCLSGKTIVLVDGKTASTAELVAQALREHKDARIWGESSRAQLLVGLWYPFDELSPGAQVVIPEAIYTSSQGRVIEGKGVELNRILYYDLPSFREGKEPWLSQALEELTR